MGWCELADEDLTPENSSKAVNRSWTGIEMVMMVMVVMVVITVTLIVGLPPRLTSY